VLVAYVYNPSCSGGRDHQEDLDSKPAQANSSVRPYHKKRAGGVAQGKVPEFKPEYCLMRKKDEVMRLISTSLWALTPARSPEEKGYFKTADPGVKRKAGNPTVRVFTQEQLGLDVGRQGQGCQSGTY
jgi:hypothetical protein